jgi:hypothetical protein
MNFVRFVLPNQDENLSKFLSQVGKEIQIHSKHLSPAQSPESCDILYIFYDFVEESELERFCIESERIKRLIAKAREIQTDEEYQSLKNSAQRGIWLHTKYGITGKDAGDLQELLKPEMAGILA